MFAGAFRLYDVDNDGYITRDEMYNIVDAIYQMVATFFYYEVTVPILRLHHQTLKVAHGRSASQDKNIREASTTKAGAIIINVHQSDVLTQRVSADAARGVDAVGPDDEIQTVLNRTEL
ncbi:Frequenin-1 [Eumeta japonica]|uniref:Frequenin-1 n=1 Tax=Eumeta variegata TaxID=151549 RepID=A0A4C2ACI5_EUMVA|nr:Frequenin-1 [Eumeta japonica]